MENPQDSPHIREFLKEINVDFLNSEPQPILLTLKVPYERIKSINSYKAIQEFANKLEEIIGITIVVLPNDSSIEAILDPRNK